MIWQNLINSFENKSRQTDFINALVVRLKKWKKGGGGDGREVSEPQKLHYRCFFNTSIVGGGVIQILYVSIENTKRY